MNDGADSRQKADRKLLLLFLILLVTFLALITIAFVFSNGGTGMEYASAMVAMVTISFFGCGIYAYKKYRNSSLIPRRRITKWILNWSLILSLIATIVLFIILEFFPSLVESQSFATTFEATVAVIAIYIALFLSFVLAVFFELIIAFGAIGVMAAIERRLTPQVLREISSFGEKKRLSATDHVVKWLFAIPDVVDTSLLDVHPEPRRPFVKWRDMFRPLEWQLLFGAVLAMYISLNPLIAGSGTDTLAAVFSLLTSGAIIIPVVILPWFAVQRLGAGIGGGRKEFTLFNGIRSRLLQTFFAIGTLLLLIRVLISGTNIETFVAGFSSFMVMLLLTSLICTFVYLNFFENELVEDIASGFASGRPPKEIAASEQSASEAKSS